MANPPKIFVSYSHKEKVWLDRLQEQFKPLVRGALLVAWDDTKIVTGMQWREEIARAIDEADTAVLLVSPGFLASDFIAQHELKPLLKKKRVFWIAVKHSIYEATDIGQYQCANDPAKPLASLKGDDRNKAWVEICKKILAASESIRGSCGGNRKDQLRTRSMTPSRLPTRRTARSQAGSRGPCQDRPVTLPQSPTKGAIIGHGHEPRLEHHLRIYKTRLGIKLQYDTI